VFAGETEPAIIRWIAKHDAPFCASIRQHLEALVNQGRANPASLKAGQDRNRAKPKPTNILSIYQHWRKSNMANDQTSLFSGK